MARRWFVGKAARILAPVALTALLGGSTYAFMATNYVHTSNAGAGAAAISGYTVSTIHYNLTGTAGDPSGVASVSFELIPGGGSNHPATDVAIWFNGNTADVWSTNNGLCHESGSSPPALTSWSCNLGGAKVYAGPSTELDAAASG